MAHTVYKVKGERVKSVTTLINLHIGWNKGALIGWTRKICMSGQDSMVELKTAGRIGTLAHEMIEQFIKGGSVSLDGYSAEEIGQAKTAYNAYCEWEKKRKPTYHENEIKMVSDKYKFGGTCDAICTIGNKLTILDFKTSSGVYDEFIIQLAAYRQMYQESTGKKIQQAILLKLDKEGEGYEEHRIALKDLNWGWRVFKLILKLQELKR